MPFQILDVALAAIMIISGLLALMRGFTREVLSLLAWAAAGLAAWWAITTPEIVAIAKPYIQQEKVAVIATGGVVFLIVLIIMSLISVRIGDLVLDSAAGGGIAHMADGDGAMQVADGLFLGEMIADQAEAALQVELVPVIGADAGGLLAAML